MNLEGHVQSITVTPRVWAQVARGLGLPATETGQRIRRSEFGVGDERSSPVDRTGHIMCGAWSKMKTGGPLFKKIIKNCKVVTVGH